MEPKNHLRGIVASISLVMLEIYEPPDRIGVLAKPVCFYHSHEQYRDMARIGYIISRD
jgi:hypothetical protein